EHKTSREDNSSTQTVRSRCSRHSSPENTSPPAPDRRQRLPRPPGPPSSPDTLPPPTRGHIEGHCPARSHNSAALPAPERPLPPRAWAPHPRQRAAPALPPAPAAGIPSPRSAGLFSKPPFRPPPFGKNSL